MSGNDADNDKKKNKKPGYPSFFIQRAVNGWVVRERSDDYEDRRLYIATDITALNIALNDRVAVLEEHLEAGRITMGEDFVFAIADALP